MKGKSQLCQCIVRRSSVLSRHATKKRPTAQWHFQQQPSYYFRHHYFASYITEPIQTRTINEQKEETHAPILSNSEASISASANEERSLHSTIHYVLTRDVGRLSNVNIQKARSFLSITSRWNNEKGAVLSEQLLERLFEERSTGNTNPNVVIESDMYNICMTAWNKSNADGQKIVHQVESILHRMEQRYFDHHATPPDNISYNCLIDAYSKSEDDSSDKVEAILEKMNNFAHDNNAFSSEAASRISPDATTYNSMMNYYASRKNDHISAQRAEDLLLQLSGLSQHDSSIQMDSTSFNIVLKAWGNSGGGIHGAKRAEELLRMMLKLRKEHANVQPTTLTFSTAINAYSKVAPEDSATAVKRVIELLDELEGLFVPDSENINTCYNAAANAIAKSGLPNSSELILDLMTRMKNVDAVPDCMMYTSCLEASVRSGDADAIKRGKAMLEQMINEPHFEPTSANFNILLNAILKSESEQKLEEAEKLITKMQEIGGDARPDSASFNMIIRALSRSTATDAEEKAVDYLRSMLRLYRNDEKAEPNSFTFNCVINMLARSKKEWADEVIHKTLSAMEAQERNGNASVLLDTITYNVVIGKLAESATIKNAKTVMKLLGTMEAMADAGSTAVIPDIITYTNVLILEGKVNPQRAASIASSYLTRAMSSEDKVFIDRVGFYTLLHALSRSNNFEDAVMARKAWEWIEKSDRVEIVLTSHACNLVPIAYSNSKNKTEQAAEEVLSFLSDRIYRYHQGAKDTVLPNKVGFSAAFIPLCGTDRTKDALSLLKIMKALCIETDAGCYISMFKALARRRSENGALHAQRVFQQMKEDVEDVPTAAFNAAINACSWASGSHVVQRKALDTAFEIFEQARIDNSYDAVTFGLMIKACMHLSKDDNARMKLIKPLFELCARNGLVGSMVEREMRHLASRLIPDKIPLEWTKKAKDKYR